MIDGLTIAPDFVTEDEELELVRHCAATWRGTRKLPRQVANDGRSECVRFGTVIYRDQPVEPIIPAWLVELGARLPMATPDSVTVNLWPKKAALNAHHDKGGPVVCALGLLSDGDILLVRGRERVIESVPRRGLMTLQGDAHRLWRHGVQPCRSRRISIVFRTHA